MSNLHTTMVAMVVLQPFRKSPSYVASFLHSRRLALFALPEPGRRSSSPGLAIIVRSAPRYTLHSLFRGNLMARMWRVEGEGWFEMHRGSSNSLSLVRAAPASTSVMSRPSSRQRTCYPLLDKLIEQADAKLELPSPRRCETCVFIGVAVNLQLRRSKLVLL